MDLPDQRSRRRGPWNIERRLGRHTLKLPAVPIVGLIVVAATSAMRGRRTWWTANPHLLIAMNAARTATSSSSPTSSTRSSYYVVATLRLLLSDPLFFLIGYWYGDTAVTWMETRTKTVRIRSLRQWERGFRKAVVPAGLHRCPTTRDRQPCWRRPGRRHASVRRLLAIANLEPELPSPGVYTG